MIAPHFKVLCAFLGVAGVLRSTDAHGQLVSPPHRGYMNKAGFKKIPINYDANGLNGGGISQTANGNYGVCGDPYSEAVPRAHETGGKYGKFPELGKDAIGACYKPGAAISVKAILTANHLGYFRYQLCELKGKSDRENEECFTFLKTVDGEERVPVSAGVNEYTSQIQLPDGVTCDGDSHCVLRWWYRGGNNWGGDSATQEEFWNCADIYISSNCEGNGGDTPSTDPTSAPTDAPTNAPTEGPSSKPTEAPTSAPTKAPTRAPTNQPSAYPTPSPSTNTTSKPEVPSVPSPVPSSADPTPAPSSKDRTNCKTKDRKKRRARRN